MAVVFGNEHRVVSQAMEPLADSSLSVPMRGLVESRGYQLTFGLRSGKSSFRPG